MIVSKMGQLGSVNAKSRQADIVDQVHVVSAVAHASPEVDDAARRKR